MAQRLPTDSQFCHTGFFIGLGSEFVFQAYIQGFYTMFSLTSFLYQKR